MLSKRLLSATASAPAGGADNRITLPASSQVILSVARAVSSGYSGNLIRVRRSSDDLEADIGFDGSGNLDQTALLAHTGTSIGDHGYLTTIYDQLTNDTGSDLTQATAVLQPWIVRDGAVVLENGQPTAQQPTPGSGHQYMHVTAWSGRGFSNTMHLVSRYVSTGRAGLAMSIGAPLSSISLGAVRAGQADRPDNNVGFPTYHKNGTLISPTTRAGLYDVLMDQGLNILRMDALKFMDRAQWSDFGTRYIGVDSWDGPFCFSEIIILSDSAPQADKDVFDTNQISAFGII